MAEFRGSPEVQALYKKFADLQDWYSRNSSTEDDQTRHNKVNQAYQEYRTKYLEEQAAQKKLPSIESNKMAKQNNTNQYKGMNSIEIQKSATKQMGDFNRLHPRTADGGHSSPKLHAQYKAILDGANKAIKTAPSGVTEAKPSETKTANQSLGGGKAKYTSAQKAEISQRSTAKLARENPGVKVATPEEEVARKAKAKTDTKAFRDASKASTPKPPAAAQARMGTLSEAVKNAKKIAGDPKKSKPKKVVDPKANKVKGGPRKWRRDMLKDEKAWKKNPKNPENPKTPIPKNRALVPVKSDRVAKAEAKASEIVKQGPGRAVVKYDSKGRALEIPTKESLRAGMRNAISGNDKTGRMGRLTGIIGAASVLLPAAKDAADRYRAKKDKSDIDAALSSPEQAARNKKAISDNEAGAAKLRAKDYQETGGIGDITVRGLRRIERLQEKAGTKGTFVAQSKDENSLSGPMKKEAPKGGMGPSRNTTGDYSSKFELPYTDEEILAWNNRNRVGSDRLTLNDVQRGAQDSVRAKSARKLFNQ